MDFILSVVLIVLCVIAFKKVIKPQIEFENEYHNLLKDKVLLELELLKRKLNNKED